MLHPCQGACTELNSPAVRAFIDQEKNQLIFVEKGAEATFSTTFLFV
jgi:hypothetical protein